MRVKIIKGLIITVPVFFIVGCNRELGHRVENQREMPSLNNSIEKLPRDIQDLSADDARIVANQFDRSIPTKSGKEKVVESVIPILGENGDILMYAVNYTDGYILVSATTNYYPILAIVEQGAFSILPNSGQEFIIDEIKTAVSLSKTNPVRNAKKAWEQFLKTPSFERTATKVGLEYYILLDDYIMDWYDDDRTIYVLRNQPENMPDDMYEYFCESASLDMPYDYPYMDCAIITEKYFSSSTTFGPFLQTKWAQSGPGNNPLDSLWFNSAVPNNLPLGCATVAVGQIMRYFEYPSLAYNWSAMPNTTSNTVLSSFLATLRTELHVDDTGGTTYYRARNTFEDYGYSVTIDYHSSTDVYSSLSNGRPVYMHGYNLSTFEGHEWVCDGYYSSYGYYEYKLYILRVLNGQPHDFAEWECDQVYEFGPSLFHMNWGWAGSQNGYYNDSSVPYGFTDIRRDLFISTP